MALTQTLQDNFNDNVRDASKWTSFGTLVAETNGELQLTTQLGGGYKGYTSLATFDLTGSYFSVEVINAGNQALNSLEVALFGMKDSNNNVFWLISGNLIMAYKKVGGTVTQLATAAYLPAAHKFFRIRELSGTTFWEYSSDGLTWTALHSAANPFVITALFLELSTGTWNTEAAVTTAVFDNFNLVTDNKYVGSAPNAANAGAIIRNAKLVLKQGYVTTAGNEVVTYKTFYIDEIKQLAAAASNKLVFIARDGIKKLINWKASQQVQFTSQYKLYEPFDNLNAWQTVAGSWSIVGGRATALTPSPVAIFMDEPKTTIRGVAPSNFVMKIKARSNLTNGQFGISFRYQDPTSYYRAVISDTNVHLQKIVGGLSTNLSAAVGYGGLAANTDFWIQVIALNNKFWVYTSADNVNWTTRFDGVTDNTYTKGLVGIEAGLGGATSSFDEVVFYDLTPDKSIEYLMTDVAIKSGIDSQVFDTLFEENFSSLAKWDTAGDIGDWTVSGNELTGTAGAGSEAMLLTTSAYQFDNFSAEVEINQSANSHPWFVFRATDTNNCYIVTSQVTGTMATALIYKRVAGAYTLIAEGLKTLRSNGTYYKWKITANGSWITFEVDGQILVSVYDTTYTTGKIGFRTNIPGTIKAKNLRLPQLWQPVPTFTLNPGASGLEGMLRLAATQKVRFWMTWDDKLKARKLSSADPSVYTYGNSQFTNNYDLADVQLNHVVVYGNNSVVGESWDYASITALGEERYATVTDLTLTTADSCNKLAEEIINTSKRTNQRSILVIPNNVGLEKYDVITVSDARTGQAAAAYRVVGLSPRYDSSGSLYEQTLEVEQRV